MIKIKPVGAKIIVQPITQELQQTDSGLFVIDNDHDIAIVVEVGDMGDLYKEGDKLIYQKDTGFTLPHYKKKSCLWLDGRSYPNGNVVGIIIEG